MYAVMSYSCLINQFSSPQHHQQGLIFDQEARFWICCLSMKSETLYQLSSKKSIYQIVPLDRIKLSRKPRQPGPKSRDLSSFTENF